MWPFRRKEVSKGGEIDPRGIESRIRALELDWEDTYERIRKVLQRISKRAESLEKLEANRDRSEGGTPQELAPEATGVTGRLNERQRAIQQQILRRRTGG